ncbi:FixH family protein [Paenibacillus tritici]|uniref:FixH family protein n=1 Tax=Paenibacillus tritici TaxID=1873425 RepID=A0ABX2DY88_9BACL|nr:FixH family protein [Paenibacillus tritici]NQX48933.1 FixH family protein [Paenibacillus tritici]QUL52455.1 FixH family protein [Paenibacillus tritici]
MMKPKIRRGLMCIMLGLALAGCSEDKEGDMQMYAAGDSSMTPIKVELSWSPEDVTAGSEVSFKAVVTQDGEPVDDAREVMFEIADAADKSKKVEIKGKSDGDGAYVGDNTFEQAGEFTVTSHVTARTQHSMPSKKLVVKP